MAVPTSFSAEAFLYCWTNTQTNKIYVGVHKGTPEDGYVCSSKTMLEEYRKTPHFFSRKIVAKGTFPDMISLESSILQTVNAAKNPDYYNRNNNNSDFFCEGHSKETREKMSAFWKNQKKHNCDQKKAVSEWVGKKHQEKSKQKMREAAKKHKEKRSNKLISNNPMKDPISIQKMLAKRKLNRELRNGSSN